MILLRLNHRYIWTRALIVSVILGGILLLWATTPAAFAQEDIPIRASNYVVDSASSVDVAIELAGGNRSVAAFSIEVAYDPAIVSQTGCVMQDFTGACNEPTSGEILIAGVNVSGRSGDSQIAKITFEPISFPGDSTPLTITVLSLVDVVGTNLNPSISDGVILIRQPETARTNENQDRTFLPLIGRNQFRQSNGEIIELTLDQIMMSWICSFMHNFGWTSDACYIS